MSNNIEFREFVIDVNEYDKNKITLSIDTRQSKKFSTNNRFLTESIPPKVFINGLKKDKTLILLNHQPTQVVSNKFEARSTSTGVEIDVQLDEKNIFSTTVQSYRENGVPLSVSFGFICKEERMLPNKHREITELEIGEVSILTVPSQYFSSTRSLNQDITLEDLKNIIDESVKNAIFEQQKAHEQPKEEPKEEEKLVEEPKIEEKPVVEQVFKLDTTGLESTLKTFLDEFKDVVKPVEQPKTEEKQEEIVEKVEEKPVVDEEKVKSDIEKYKKMLEEL